jgi:hypothetical protein
VGWCVDGYVTSDPDDGGEMVLEMLVIFNQLTQLMAQEDFINISHRESFRSYFTKLVCSTAVF